MKNFHHQTHYELLEVSVSAPAEEIAGAYRRLKRIFSESTHATYGLVDSESVGELQHRLDEALAILTDRSRRAAYDESLGLPPLEFDEPAQAAPLLPQPPTQSPKPFPPTVPDALPIGAAGAAAEGATAVGRAVGLNIQPMSEANAMRGGVLPPSSTKQSSADDSEDPSVENALAPLTQLQLESPVPEVPTTAVTSSLPLAVPGAGAGPAESLPPPIPSPATQALEHNNSVETAYPMTPARGLAAARPVPLPTPMPMDIGIETQFTGQLLKVIREARGMTLKELSDRTRLGVRHLEQIEAEKWDVQPATVYLRGYLTSVARELSLDASLVANSYLSHIAAKK